MTVFLDIESLNVSRLIDWFYIQEFNTLSEGAGSNSGNHEVGAL